MEPTTEKEVHKALAMRLAKRDISDKVLASAASKITKNGLKVGGVDFCPYGICIDYYIDKKFSVDELLADSVFRAVKIFPYGILVDDLWRVQMEMHVPELAEMRVRG